MMTLFQGYHASSFNETDDKILIETSSSSSTAKPDSNELPDSILRILEYVKGRYEVGPPIHLGDDPEPEDTVYDTTVNPLPLSPPKPIPGHIPRHERTQIQLPRSRKPASLGSPREENNQISSVVSPDSVLSSVQVEEKRNPNPHLIDSDGDPEISSEDPLPQSCYFTEAGELNFMMLNARRLKEFLTENVNEHATNLLFLTIHGTLLAHNITPDPATSAKAFRKFSAFAGPTFSLHSTAIANTGKLSPNPGFFGGRVLKVSTRGDGKGLKSMIVEQDDVVSAVVYCKDDTLIAAQLPKGSFPSSDDLIGKVQNLELSNSDPAIGQIENEVDKSDESGVESEDGDSNNSKGKGKARSEDTEEEENKPSKIRILELRAEAIAEVMVEDELKDFMMPKDFH